jgi:hypothetical protein
MVDKPHEINTALGTAGALAHTLTPKTAFRVLNLAYKVFPDSAAARGKDGDSKKTEPETVEPEATTQQQLMLARLTKGVHW